MRRHQMTRRGGRQLLAVAGALALLAAFSATAASASTKPSIYVSPSGKAGASGTSCGSAKFSSIASAIAAASQGSTVVVCQGQYPGGIAVSKSVILKGEKATVNATGDDNGFTITTSNVTVEGFTVKDAIGEGILATGATGSPLTGVTISGNIVSNNDVGASEGAAKNYGGYSECEKAGDCGLGLHLLSVSHSTVSGNIIKDNYGGILITDENGPSDHDTVDSNTINDNPGACAITLAGHNGKALTSSGQVAPNAAGVYDIVVHGNTADDNGLKGGGGGVIIATPVPGGAVYDNTITDNTLDGNGMAGVALHAHAPNEDLNGNVVSDNQIGPNNLKGDPDYPDAKTTAVVVASSFAPVSINVSHNKLSDNVYGIWQSKYTTVTGVSTNSYSRVTTHDYQSSAA